MMNDSNHSVPLPKQRLKKLILTVSVLLLTFSITQAQQITLKATKQPIADVIKKLRAQTDYAVMVQGTTLTKANPVTVDFRNISLQKALEEIFKNQPIYFEIKDRTILIKEREKPKTIDNRSVAPDSIRGRVTNEKGEPLIGASVYVLDAAGKRTGVQVRTDEEGRFEFLNVVSGSKLEVTFLGYTAAVLTASHDQMLVSLKSFTTDVAEVEVVNTGYQKLPKERATGSYTQLDNSKVGYSVGLGVLDRLADQVPGLIFNTVGTKAINNNNILIRGQSTIRSRTDPLIVIDNFPYDGDLNTINPEDVENITILRDAVASSIWGARAGNGVIVITTKQGKYNSKTKLSVSSAYTLGQKPDLSYRQAIRNADYIELEKELFAKGVYNNDIVSTAKLPLSEVVELLLQKKNHPEKAVEIDRQIEALKSHDLRDELSKYAYRNSVLNQLALNLNGGSDHYRYYVSGGVDKNLESTRGNGLDRYTLRFDNVLKVLGDRIEINPQINYSSTTTNTFFIPVKFSSLYPYAQIVDQNGNGKGLALDYSSRFIEESRGLGFYDWSYNLLDEIERSNNTSRSHDLRISLRTDVDLSRGFAVSLNYQHSLKFGTGRTLNDKGDYFTRTLLNQYSSINTQGVITRSIPDGSILDYFNQLGNGYNFRTQFSYSGNNQLTGLHVIAGYEISEDKMLSREAREYGYDQDYGVISQVDYKTSFVLYPNSNLRGQIPFKNKEGETMDRFVSLYGNASYEWLDRYSISSSVRWDRSNLFGVKTNQKGVPLYSIGGAWNLKNEFFQDYSLLNSLKLRLTHGSSGNVNRTLSAYTTARYSAFQSGNGLKFASIVNPPNPQLRWEQVTMQNIGLDLSMLDRRINASIDYYHKEGKDIIGESPLAPQTGVASFIGNTAHTSGFGWDLTLNTVNIDRPLRWTSDFLYHFEKEKVNTYLLDNITARQYTQNTSLPAVGFPLYAYYSYRSAGLSPDDGAPRGYLQGAPSVDYAKIMADTKFEDLVYHGSARPTHFGSFRNSLAYKGIMLSFTLNFKLGYYFRRESIDHNLILQGRGGHVDYYDRWQKPGDELNTVIPSAPLLINANRNTFFRYSDVLVEPGDHIRFQDIKLSYEFHRVIKKDWFRSATVFAFANNMGLLWTKNKLNIDPDVIPLVDSFRTTAPFSLSIGLQFNL